jgi:hypothetical protein
MVKGHGEHAELDGHRRAPLLDFSRSYHISYG